MYDIFLSYSTKDRDRLQPLFQALEQQRWSVFWDHQSIHTGENWHRKIYQAISESRCVVVVWSKSSVDSEYVLEEAAKAKARNVLLPIRIDGVEPPFGFALRQAGDFTQWNGKPDHPAFIELAAQIYGLLGAGGNPPPPPPPKSSAGLWVAGFVAMSAVGGYVYTHPPQKVDPVRAVSMPVPESAAPVIAPVAESSPPLAPAKKPFEPVMKEIPAGTFTMGCDESRDVVDGMDGKCYDSEKPAHPVTLNAFQMAETETTFDQWDACEKADACPHAEDQGWGRGNRPVINVSWDDITQKYIPWLNKETGKTYRLPTEAEWEYAARGGSDTAYPWGNKASHEFANYGKDECCGGLASGKDKWFNTSPVGSFAANGYGLHDIHGNVWEWCQDWYAGDYYASSPASNPKGAASGTNRVLRGGSWYNVAQFVRSADRGSITPDLRSFDVGFRLVLP